MPETTHIVQREKDVPLRFVGQMIGYAEDEREIMALYKTAGGQYVGERISLPDSRGRHERHKGKVIKSHRDISAFFGRGQLASKLHRSANLDALALDDQFDDIS